VIKISNDSTFSELNIKLADYLTYWACNFLSIYLLLLSNLLYYKLLFQTSDPIPVTHICDLLYLTTHYNFKLVNLLFWCILFIKSVAKQSSTLSGFKNGNANEVFFLLFTFFFLCTHYLILLAGFSTTMTHSFLKSSVICKSLYWLKL